MFDFDWYKNEGAQENLNRPKKIFDLTLIYTFTGTANGLNEIMVIVWLSGMKQFSVTNPLCKWW